MIDARATCFASNCENAVIQWTCLALSPRPVQAISLIISVRLSLWSQSQQSCFNGRAHSRVKFEFSSSQNQLGFILAKLNSVKRNGQIKCSPRAMESRYFFIIWPSERFQRWMVLFDLLLFQFIGSQFPSIGSWMSELVAFQFIWSVAKFLLWISIDDGTFSYVLSSFGFNVETDVGINGCFAPFWLLGTHYLNLAAWFE